MVKKLSREKRYKQALQDILEPLSYLQRKAKESGAVLNAYAVTLAQSPSLFREIARHALEEADAE